MSHSKPLHGQFTVTQLTRTYPPCVPVTTLHPSGAKAQHSTPSLPPWDPPEELRDGWLAREKSGGRSTGVVAGEMMGDVELRRHLAWSLPVRASQIWGRRREGGREGGREGEGEGKTKVVFEDDWTPHSMPAHHIP